MTTTTRRALVKAPLAVLIGLLLIGPGRAEKPTSEREEHAALRYHSAHHEVPTMANLAGRHGAYFKTPRRP